MFIEIKQSNNTFQASAYWMNDPERAKEVDRGFLVNISMIFEINFRKIDKPGHKLHGCDFIYFGMPLYGDSDNSFSLIFGSNDSGEFHRIKRIIGEQTLK